MNRFALILSIYLAFASAFAGGVAHILHVQSAAAGDPPVAQPPKYLVLMVLDGARPDYLDSLKLPHLAALTASGTQYTNAFDGILEAETPAGHATLATGSRPDKDGLLGFDWANDNDRYSLFDPAKMTSVLQLQQAAGAPTIIGLYKKAFPKAVGVSLSGHKYYAATPLGGPDADAILYYQGDPKGRYVPVAVPGHVPPSSVLNAPGLIGPSTKLPDGAEDRLATQLALTTVAQMHPRLLLINYPEFDWPLGHVYGGDLAPSKVATDMQVFDDDLGKIEDAYRKLGILDQTLFVITADHGMMPISRFIPATVVNNAVTQAGTSAPDIANSTAAYVWLADVSKAQAVAQNIVNAHDPGIQSVYYLTTAGGKTTYVSANPSGVSAATDAANQYLLSGLLNGHQPTVVAFGREGATFSDPQTGWKADHGGNSWESQHIPLVLAGPGIRSGTVINSAAELDDIAPTVLSDMGVPPAGMEGHVLTDALSNPHAPEVRTRGAEISQLQPLADALAAQSKKETGS